MALFYPLDQLRVHEQLASSELSPRQRLNILKALRMRLQLVGFAGLYQGLPSSLVAIVWANFARVGRTRTIFQRRTFLQVGLPRYLKVVLLNQKKQLQPFSFSLLPLPDTFVVCRFRLTVAA